MKTMRKCLSVCMVLLICLTMTITAYAASYGKSKTVEGYGVLRGSTSQSGWYLATTATVEENTDQARLRIKTELVSNNFVITSSPLTVTSNRGNVSLGQSVYLAYPAGYPPTRAYITCDIYQGTTYNADWVYYNLPVDSSVLN